MRKLIVIPARRHSKRFPGKPLAQIAGRTLLEWVAICAKTAAAAGSDVDVIVATDDDEIADHATSLDLQSVITKGEVSSGTERALAICRMVEPVPQFVVNLQGDAIFARPATITRLFDELARGEAAVATPIVRLDWEMLDQLRRNKEMSPFTGTTCIRGKDGNALWFSKSIIPAIRDEEARRQTERHSPVWQHVGVYGYTPAALEWFGAAEPGYYEQLESLEQLRFIEGGIPIKTVEIEASRWPLSGIDTPADAARTEELILRDGHPNFV